MKKIVMSLAALSVLFGLSLTAQTPEMGQKPCREDVNKFCKDIRPGGGRIWACLKSHEAELSAPCREHMALMREKMSGFMQACRSDRRKFCSGIPAGRGRIVACLKSHLDELSEECKAFFEKN